MTATIVKPQAQSNSEPSYKVRGAIKRMIKGSANGYQPPRVLFHPFLEKMSSTTRYLLVGADIAELDQDNYATGKSRFTVMVVPYWSPAAFTRTLHANGVKGCVNLPNIYDPTLTEF